MTTPPFQDPSQPPDPGRYQPPDPSQYQPPSGASYGTSGQTGGYPQPGQPGQQGAYPPPDPNAYPPPPGQQGAYPPPDPNAYPPPGQPGAYPPPPGQPDGGAAAVPAKNNAKSRLIVTVVVVAVVVLGIVLYVVNRGSDPSTATVGDCVKVLSMSSDNADVEKIDCKDPGASFKVTATGDTVSCDEKEDKYTESTKSGKTTTALCLQPNVTAGDCWQTPTDPNKPEAKVDCAKTKGETDVVKVLKFDHSTSDPKACPADTQQYLSYTVHQGVLCVEPNN